MQQKTIIIAAIALLSLLAASLAAYAVLKYTGTVTNTATILGYQLSLWRTDSNVPITAIPWGSLETGTTKDTEQVFSLTQQLKIKNVGDYACWIAWKIDPVTPLPNGITLSAHYYISGDAWYALPQNMFSDSNWGQVLVNAYTAFPVRWTLTVPIDAPRGPLAFSIQLLAANTATG